MDTAYLKRHLMKNWHRFRKLGRRIMKNGWYLTELASAALRGDVGPVLKSIARKTLINYGKRKAKDFVFGKLTVN